MGKIEIKKKRIYCYITWFLFMFFSILMLALSINAHWSGIPLLFIFAIMVSVTYVTFSESVSEKMQSHFIVFSGMGNLFVYSVIEEDIYSVLIVTCALAVLISGYMNVHLQLEVLAMTLIMIIVHAEILHTVNFEEISTAVQFISRVFALLLIESFLIFFIQRICKIEEDLKTSVVEARKAEHSKSDFLANMSHEIRTPMNAIIGMCELILRDDINEQVRENCFNIQNSGRSLLAIINDILDFSKIESGKAELIEEEFNIGSTVNDVMNMALTRKGDKNIDIIARVDPDIPKGLFGDEVRIKQIIINLMTNAVKFTNTGCVVLKITQSRHKYGINLNVSVRDTGIGISEENLEKLFTSFQQVDTRKNRSVEGTGLGLAISKRLVSKMGGFINVSSTYGKGSEFKFVIPLEVTDEEPFVHIKNTSEMKVAIYVDVKKYKHPRNGREYTKLINEMGEKFGVVFDLFYEPDALKEAVVEKVYTHCFTAKEEYLADSDFFENLSKQMQVLVIQDRLHSADLPKSVKCVFKPFYALSVAAVLNNERYNFNINDRQNGANRFTAPEAKVLIVDDNITNLKVAEGLMRPYNMKIITAESGKEAIKALKAKDYDIVFMDHMMPEMDGVETTRFIRSMEGEYYKNLPIIALTANAVNGVKEKFLQSGFNDFVAKPIELSLLDRALRTWLPEEHIKSFTTKIDDSESDYKQIDVKDVENAEFAEHINSQKGLLYAGNDQEVYFQNLKIYLENGIEQNKLLEKYFSEEDWSDYVIKVHALKSASLSIGAEKLSELAKSLEMAGKEGNYALIRERHAELSDLFENVLSAVKKYLTKNNYHDETVFEEMKNELSEITIEQFDDSLQLLEAAFENFDGDEMAAIAEELCSSVVNGNELRSYFTKVKSLAEDFEYEKAMEVAKHAAMEVREV